MKVSLTLLWCQLAAASQAPQSLSLSDVLRSIDRRFPPLEAAERESDAAKGELRASLGSFDLLWRSRASRTAIGFYPTERFDSFLEQPTTLWGTTILAGYRLGTGKFAVYDGKAETLPSGELRLGIEVPLWRNGPIDRRRANIDRARFGITAADAQIKQTRIETVRAATHRYWDWSAAFFRRKVVSGLLQIARERDAFLEKRVKAGDIPLFEKQDNERTILQRQSQYISADRSLQQAAIELSLYHRDESANPILSNEDVAPADLPSPQPAMVSFENALAQALAERPELRRLAAQREQSEIEMEWARNQLTPRIDFQVSASRDLGTGTPSLQEPELEVGVVLEIPLERNVAAGRTDSAVATNSRIELQQQFQRDRIAADVRDARSNLNAAFERYQLTHRELVLNRALENGERERFRQGDSNILFVNLREQATADSAIREIDAQADCQKSIASLRAAMGQD